MCRRHLTNHWERQCKRLRLWPCQTSKKRRSGSTDRQRRRETRPACRERCRLDFQGWTARKASASPDRFHLRSRCSRVKGIQSRNRWARHRQPRCSGAGSRNLDHCKDLRNRRSGYNPSSWKSGRLRRSCSTEFPECKRSPNQRPACWSNSNK